MKILFAKKGSILPKGYESFSKADGLTITMFEMNLAHGLILNKISIGHMSVTKNGMVSLNGLSFKLPERLTNKHVIKAIDRELEKLAFMLMAQDIVSVKQGQALRQAINRHDFRDLRTVCNDLEPISDHCVDKYGGQWLSPLAKGLMNHH